MVDYPIVTMNEDGTLNFGLSSHRTVGAGGTGGPDAGIGLKFTTAGHSVMFTQGVVTYTAGSVTSALLATIVLPYSGWYNVHATIEYVSNNATESLLVQIQSPTDPDSTYWVTVHHPENSPITFQTFGADISRWVYRSSAPVTIKVWGNSAFGTTARVEVVHFG
jgi:hypothetical protein